MEYKQLGMTNQDAEWLASRTFTISDIARIYNISPIFLQDYSNSSYSNFSEASRAFLSQTLRPWLTNFEQQLKDALMVDVSRQSKQRYLIEFDTSDLLRTSQNDRFNSYDTAIKAGIMNPNEVRRREGLTPYAGGDEFSQAWKQTVEVKKVDAMAMMIRAGKYNKVITLQARNHEQEKSSIPMVVINLFGKMWQQYGQVLNPYKGVNILVGHFS